MNFLYDLKNTLLNFWGVYKPMIMSGEEDTVFTINKKYYMIKYFSFSDLMKDCFYDEHVFKNLDNKEYLAEELNRIEKLLNEKLLYSIRYLFTESTLGNLKIISQSEHCPINIKASVLLNKIKYVLINEIKLFTI